MLASSKQGRLALASLAAVALAVGVAGCGETVTTKSYSGESHHVEQRIASFQRHVSESSQKKLCDEDLSAAIKSRLSPAGGCEQVLKEQLKDVEDLTLTIKSITVKGKSATAELESTRAGKPHKGTLTLTKEAGGWRIAGL